MQKAKVVYIACWGRSGSTLLNNILGQSPYVFSGGELLRIWEDQLLQEGICGCGCLIRECPVWKAILRSVWTGFDERTIEDLRSFLSVHVRTKNIPTVMLSRSFAQQDASRCSQLQLVNMYKLIQSTTGCEFIVDSSKHPVYGALLQQQADIDMYLVHLIRDPRAVAFSWQRKKFMPDSKSYFRTRGPMETAIMWLTWNLGIQRMGTSLKKRYLRIRYEDLVARPTDTLGEIATFLGLESLEISVSEKEEIVLNPTHTVMGNPIRFSQGPVKLRLDNEWKSNLSKKDSALISLATWPLLWKYAY